MRENEVIIDGCDQWMTYTVPGKQVEVHVRNELGELKGVRLFRVGDEAEHHRIWLGSDEVMEGCIHRYLGTIKAIGRKTVTIDPGYGNKNRRLYMSDFVRRNWNL